jgi:hypothetical protein
MKMNILKANPLNEQRDIAQRAIFRILWLFLPAVIMLVAIPRLRENFHLMLIALTVVVTLSLFVDIYRLKKPDSNKTLIYCFRAGAKGVKP